MIGNVYKNHVGVILHVFTHLINYNTKSYTGAVLNYTILQSNHLSKQHIFFNKYNKSQIVWKYIPHGSLRILCFVQLHNTVRDPIDNGKCMLARARMETVLIFIRRGINSKELMTAP